MSEFEPLTTGKDGVPISFVRERTESDLDHSFEVHDVQTTLADGTIDETEQILSGSVSWDGCVHMTFDPQIDGYVHVCGEWGFARHLEMLNALRDWMRKRNWLSEG